MSVPRATPITLASPSPDPSGGCSSPPVGTATDAVEATRDTSFHDASSAGLFFSFSVITGRSSRTNLRPCFASKRSPAVPVVCTVGGKRRYSRDTMNALAASGTQFARQPGARRKA